MGYRLNDIFTKGTINKLQLQSIESLELVEDFVFEITLRGVKELSVIPGTYRAAIEGRDISDKEISNEQIDLSIYEVLSISKNSIIICNRSTRNYYDIKRYEE